MSDCPADYCDGRSVHDPPYRPAPEFYDYVDPDSGHAIKVVKTQGEHGGVVEVAQCQTRMYRTPANGQEDSHT